MPVCLSKSRIVISSCIGNFSAGLTNTTWSGFSDNERLITETRPFKLVGVPATSRLPVSDMRKSNVPFNWFCWLVLGAGVLTSMWLHRLYCDTSMKKISNMKTTSINGVKLTIRLFAICFTNCIVKRLMGCLEVAEERNHYFSMKIRYFVKVM